MPNNYKDQFSSDGFAPADFNLTGPPKPISKGQKVAVVFLAFFGLFVIIAWAVQLNKSIRAPFAPAGKTQALSQAATARSEQALKSQDTDSDGLSDWDELNVYKTSPYLEDTDSDGINDKAEVEAGTDPNCPAGRDCYSSGLAEPTGEEAASSSGNILALPGLNAANQASLNQAWQIRGVNANNGQTAATTSQSSINSDYLKLISGNIDPATLRRILLEHGMDKKMLDKISDDQLMQSFRETWQKQMKQ